MRKQGNAGQCSSTLSLKLKLNDSASVHTDINYDARIWQFATSDVLESINTNACMHAKFQEYKKLLGELNDAIVISDENGKNVNYTNEFCVFTSQCPNIAFENGREFITGAYELPVKASISKNTQTFEMKSSIFHKYVNFPYGEYDVDINYNWNTADPKDEYGLDKYFADESVTIENSELKRVRNFLYPEHRESDVNVTIDVPLGGFKDEELPKDLATMINDIKKHCGESFSDKFHVIFVHACTCGGALTVKRTPAATYAQDVYSTFCEKFPKWMNKELNNQLGGRFKVTKRGTYYIGDDKKKYKVGIEKKKLVILEKA
jgi:hypothetical protein